MKKSKKISLSSIFSNLRKYWPIYILTAIGIALRTLMYLSNKSFATDESYIARFIYNGTPGQAPFTQPLGFLNSLEILTSTFGYDEWVFRLVPFIAGIAAIPLFYLLARKLLRNRASVILVLAIFILSAPLIRFSWETKQYSSDVLLTIVLLLLGNNLVRNVKKLRIRNLVIFTAATLTALWFSDMVIIVYGGVMTTLLISLCKPHKQSERKQIIWLMLSALPIIVFFSWRFFRHMSIAASDDFINNFWRNDFLVFPFSSIENFNTFLDVLLEFFDFPLGIPTTSLGLFLVLFGMITINKKDLRAWLPYILVLGCSLVLSLFRKLPLDWPALFLVPIILLLLGHGVDSLIKITGAYRKKFGPILTAALFVLLLWLPIGSAATLILEPTPRMDMKSTVQYLQENYADGDIVYIAPRSKVIYSYYAKIFKTGSYNSIIGRNFAVSAPEMFDSRLEKIAKRNDRAWIIIGGLDKRPNELEKLRVEYYYKDRAILEDRISYENIELLLYSFPDTDSDLPN